VLDRLFAGNMSGMEFRGIAGLGMPWERAAGWDGWSLELGGAWGARDEMWCGVWARLGCTLGERIVLFLGLEWIRFFDH
jgi:hypothetical protein